MRVLAIGAHPDDIEFGCGGTLLQHAARGDSITMLVMSSGERAGNASVREAEQEHAAQLIAADLIMLDFPDGNFGPVHQLVNQLESVLATVQPGVVYTHLASDMHQDHVSTHRATQIAARELPAVLLYESPRSAVLSAGIFVDISDVMDKKIELLKAHESQVSRNRNVGEEAIRARAVLHGMQFNVPAAEVFNALRCQWPISQRA